MKFFSAAGKVILAATFCAGTLTGCGVIYRPFSAEDARAILESAYDDTFTCLDSVSEDGDNRFGVKIHTFSASDGETVTFRSDVEKQPNGTWKVCGESDYLSEKLQNTYAQLWNVICDFSHVLYEWDGATLLLYIEYTETEKDLTYATYDMAEVILSLFDAAPLSESQVDGYIPTDAIRVFYQTEPFENHFEPIASFRFAETGLYTLDYVASQLQFGLRAADIL